MILSLKMPLRIPRLSATRLRCISCRFFSAALQDTFWVARKRTSRTFGLMGVVPDSGVKYSGVDITSWLVVLGRLRSRFRSSGGGQQRVRQAGTCSPLVIPPGAAACFRSRGSSDFDSQSSAAVATRRGRSSGWGFKRSRRRFPLAFVGEARHLVAVLDFRITLEARNPARGCLRHYRVEAGTDLFGVWVVEISYGRIGTVGRSRQLCRSRRSAGPSPGPKHPQASGYGAASHRGRLPHPRTHRPRSGGSGLASQSGLRKSRKTDTPVKKKSGLAPCRARAVAALNAALPRPTRARPCK